MLKETKRFFICVLRFFCTSRQKRQFYLSTEKKEFYCHYRSLPSSLFPGDPFYKFVFTDKINYSQIMPRPKRTIKSATKTAELQNGLLESSNGEDVVSSTTNGNSNNIEAVAPSLEKEAPEAATKGRGRKKNVMPDVAEAVKIATAKKTTPSASGSSRRKPSALETAEENGVSAAMVEVTGPEIKQDTVKAKGRGKKVNATKSKEPEAELIEEMQEKPTARGRVKKPAAAEKDDVILKQGINQEIVEVRAVKVVKEVPSGAGKGRKKKEPVIANEIEVPAAIIVTPIVEVKDEVAIPPKKRASNKKAKLTEETLTSDLQELSKTASLPKQKKIENLPKVEKSKKTAATTKLKSAASATVEDNVPVEEPAARGRKRGKNIATDSAVKAEELANSMSVESPKKKIKQDVAVRTEKKKRGVKTIKTLDEEQVPEEEIKAISENTGTVEKKPVKPRRKRAIAEIAATPLDNDDELDGAKPAKSKKAATTINSTETIYNQADFNLPPLDNDSQDNAAEKRYNLKISSWNVAGLRSWLKKDGLKFLEYEEPDIFCMQEIKCTTDQLPEEAARIPGYHPYWHCMPGGYAGVAIYSKIMPINVENGIGVQEFDDYAGRILTAEYEKFFLICVYVPNSGRKLVNLQARMRWEKHFQIYVQQLDALKPVIICGDMNVSHLEIDLANPKSNTRNAGFTKEERDKMSELLALGYVDTFRHLYPERKGAYTFWTYMSNARARNVGWRLDYFLVSQRITKRIVDNCIRAQCKGSDHCPITLFLKL